MFIVDDNSVPRMVSSNTTTAVQTKRPASIASKAVLTKLRALELSDVQADEVVQLMTDLLDES